MKNKVWENPQIIALNARQTMEDNSTDSQCLDWPTTRPGDFEVGSIKS